MGLERTVQLGEWEFHLFNDSSGLFISVPDCGGMADSQPRDANQLAWAERAFAEVPAMEQVWPTTWKVPPEAVAELEALFRRRGAAW